MLALDLSLAESASGQIQQEHVAAAVNALRTDGMVVLNNIVDPTHLDQLRERMLADLDVILQREDTPYNFTSSNVQQDPPPFPPYLFRDILLNDMVIAVTRAMLGPGVKNIFYSGNTALPSEQRQPVHPDQGQLWPNLAQATPAFNLVVNVPLVDVSDANGSTELWPGTHVDTTYTIHDGSSRVAPDLLEARRAVRPPIQPDLKLGSVLIRDIRMWHAGMPNRTTQPRPMLAMIHACSWWSNSNPIVFPQGTESFFTHPELTTDACFVPEQIDYTGRHQSYDVRK